jgi:hypothetical protein
MVDVLDPSECGDAWSRSVVVLLGSSDLATGSEVSWTRVHVYPSLFHAGG